MLHDYVQPILFSYLIVITPHVNHQHPSNTKCNNNPKLLQTPVLPGIGAPNWFLLVLLSPYAGIYYWRSGDRVDDMKIKLATNDDDTMNEITIEGNDEEIERIWRTLNLQEKGMVRVEGIMG
jgi:hypothetical protein